MLAVGQTRSKANYAYRNGMSNVSWVAGILREISADRSEGFIQQTNNLNQMIRFKCEKGVAVPDSFSNGQPIKIIARMLPDRVKNQPSLALEVKRFEMPSIYDMPAREAWEQSQRAGVPTDEKAPDALPEKKLNGWRVQDTGNMSHLAGFVAAYKYEPPKKPGGGYVVILIRQTKDDDDLLPVRCQGPDALALSRRLKVGMPLYFEGRISVLVKNTGDAAGSDGVLPTDKFQYLRVRSINVPGTKHIANQPDWVQEMIQDAQSQRHKKQAVNEAASKSHIEQSVQGAQIPVDQIVQSVATAESATPQSTDTSIPPEVLALIQKS